VPKTSKSAQVYGVISRRRGLFISALPDFYFEKKKKKGFQVAPPVAGAQVAFRFEIFFFKIDLRLISK
jgi:hypothetical protein